MYLRAGDRMSRLNRWDLLTAIGMLENATGLDPDFADAWGRLAEACVQLAVTFENKPQWFRKAESAIGKALRLDRTNADALCAKGQLLWTPSKRFENATALRALHKAIESNPGCHQAQIWLGLIFLHLGLHDDARHWLFSALATNPQDPRTLVFLGQTALYEGKYEEAYDYEMRALAIDPGNMFGNLFFPTIPLYLGRPDETAEKIRVARQMLPGEATVTSIEALLWAHRGERRRAEQIVEKALTGGKPLLHTHHMWQNAAAVYSLTGKPAKAITWMRKAARFGLPNYPLFSTDPFYRPLHNQPAYLRLMAELKKEWTGYRRVFGSKVSSPVS
jgi:tetratricopeptide (TPR) repeat protein